ncbi:hypothetical protein SAMN05660359_04690 [Geodermatophilus obscurus]|uniref:Phage integrase family protein n=1 Tax=Geodermatophilus obscurus TaxID=1861 RepID=A0A1I5IKS3_9ACTN|nr:hypothetical protein [Geodermatophilus obscurus]SFO60949.1 hypothetical protein SAMN05660359_04690 [Geodermatophilus obscurus]
MYAGVARTHILGSSIGRLTLDRVRPSHVEGWVGRLLRDLRASQTEERRRAGSLWRETGFASTTETGGLCDPRNALRALEVDTRRAGIANAGLHTFRHSAPE